MTALQDARTARDWKKSQLIYYLRQAAKRRGVALGSSDESLDRMIREWEYGRRPLSGEYLQLFCDVYEATAAELGCLPDDEPPEAELDEALALKRELFAATSADLELVTLFESVTENFRQMDRRLGARSLLPQSRAHVEQMENLLRHGLSPGTRAPIAAALTEAAALAGWQALDLGHYREAWQLHEVAKSAARESENGTLLAHVTAQQAYVLLDLDQPAEAAELMRHAHASAGVQLHPLMRAWLHAAEAEALAAGGSQNTAATLRAFEAAEAVLPADPTDPKLPFLFLAGGHLARWRGNCLARLGLEEAITDLHHALETMDPGFNRAEAGLRCDLAMALNMRGEVDQARKEAERAQQLAALTGSARQRRRIASLLLAG
jgi:tetratricopeptide (TPR) repeat protein